MFTCRNLIHLSISIILFLGVIRCEYDFDDDNGYNSTEDNDYEDVSKPNCSESCENGSCTDTDTCLCHNGYLPSHIDKFDCEPICGEADIESTGCTNGVCIAPQVCECLDGFVQSEIHPFTCTTDDDGNNNDDDGDNTHKFRDKPYVFWISMSALLVFIAGTIIALIVWTAYTCKASYVVDENGSETIVKYNVAKNKLDSEVTICIKE